MSTFQLNFTPPRWKKTRDIKENHKPILVQIGPFSSKSIVAFEDVPVTKTAKRYLLVANTTDTELEVRVTKSLSSEYNLQLEWMSAVIGPNSDRQLELIWSPEKEFSVRETIQFTDNRNLKKDVSIILKSVNRSITQKKASTTYKTNQTVKTLKLKKSSPQKLVTKPLSHIFSQKQNHPSVSCLEEDVNSSTTIPLQNISNAPNDGKYLEIPQYMCNGKENKTPERNATAMNLFDDIIFTPVASSPRSRNIDYLASLPTPTAPSSSDKTFKYITTSESTVTPSYDSDRDTTPKVHFEAKPKSTKKSVRIVEFDEVDRKTIQTTISSNIFNETYKLNTEKTITYTAISNQNLTIINEENESSNRLGETFAASTSKFHQTYCVENNDTKEILDNVSLAVTPLRKRKSTSMRDLNKDLNAWKSVNQGSMPNLHDIETPKPIETNRFYYQNAELLDTPKYETEKVCLNNSMASDISEVSTASNNEYLFRAHEIRAHSSRYNLHEISQTPNFASDRTLNHHYESIILSTAKKPLNKSQLDQIQKNNSEMASLSSITMIVTPPKRMKLENTDDDVFLKPGRGFRTDKWSHCKPKRMSKEIMSLKLHKKSKTPQKRVILYDSDMHLKGLINPDPFAATTTCDPFLTSSMFLDEEYIDKLQLQFRKWLNALVTLPADIQTVDHKVDIGKLFNEVKNKPISMPLTKEKVSSKYFNSYRLDTLRNNAISLYLDENVTIPLSKVAVLVEKQMLAIRKDRDIHLDIILQRDLLELLLNFNPLWLRIGLEVVFGEQLMLSSNSDVSGISRFILNRLFKNEVIMEKYSRPSMREEGVIQLKKFTLKKILCLLLFLDTAKRHKIIVYNPCLFMKGSPYKETKEILFKVSSMVLANMGSIQRDLKRVGYELSFKQTYLDEFDYSFKNLAIDLRDGVRLTRIMELILLRDDMTVRLRAPAISRLQRIHNVDLALKALQEADFVLLGNIVASDIVDGHREKTFSLLWQIIYKFRAPKFISAATRIQRWWRTKNIFVWLKRRLQERRLAIQNNAATIIQSAFRRYSAEKKYIIWRILRNKAAVSIQCYYKGYIARKCFALQMTSIIAIQHWYRLTSFTKRIRKRYLKIRSSVIKIQMWYRRVRLAKQIERVAHVIQTIRNETKLKLQSSRIIIRVLRSVRIHSKWHAAVNDMVARSRQSKLEFQSVVIIQSFFRMIKQRGRYNTIKNNAVIIQKHYRLWKLMKKQRCDFLRLKSTVITVQRKWRARSEMFIQRSSYLILRSNVIVIQSCVRRFLARKVLLKLKFDAQHEAEEKARILLETQNNAAVTIQNYFQNLLLKKKAMNEYQQLKKSVFIIQTRYRCLLKMRKQRDDYLQLKKSAIVIQSRYRATLKMRSERANYFNLVSNVVKIQRWYRATKMMQTEIETLRKIKVATITIQQLFRANRLMKIERYYFEEYRRKIILIQKYYRAKLIAKKQHEEYLELRSKTILIQQIFRARKLQLVARSEYILLRRIVIRVQIYYRAKVLGRKQYKSYQKLRNAAITIQQRFRANKQMIKARGDFLHLKSIAMFIATVRQSLLIMRICRSNYIEKRSTVVRLQTRYRALLAMRVDRERFLIMKKSVNIIQIRWRAILLQRKIRNQYLLIRSLVIFLQRRFRANRLMLAVRCSFLEKRSAAIFVQQTFRGKNQMKIDQMDYELKRKTVFGLQKYMRGYLARQLAERLKIAYWTPEKIEEKRQIAAAKKIQALWRGYKSRKANQNKQLKKISHNIIELRKTAQPTNTIKCKLITYVKSLKGKYNLQELVNILTGLNNVSRTVPHVLKDHATFISIFCYGIMSQAIRSEPDKQIIELCSCIILNMARYGLTRDESYQEQGLLTIAQMLYRWCDKKCGIFNTLCTLVWIFAHDKKKRDHIRKHMIDQQAMYLLRETKKLVKRKETMMKNVKQPNLRNETIPHIKTKLPNLNPDFGVIKNQPYTFNCSVFAFDCVLAKLNISL